MASTGGGFLLGFGLCLLLMSLVLVNFVTSVYGELSEYKNEISMLYDITHSPGYQDVINALNALSNVAPSIRDALCNPLISWMSLCGYGEELTKTISKAANYMIGLQRASEELYYTYVTMPMAIESLWIMALVGLAMIGAGTALIIRARRKERKMIKIR